MRGRKPLTPLIGYPSVPKPGGDPVSVISIVGGESTGKSTLTTELAQRLPGVAVPETLRQWVATHGRVPDASEQWDVFDLHVAAVRAAKTTALVEGLRWVVSDSGPLMTAVYSMQYYGSTELLDAAIEHAARSALVVWCDDDFPWQPDPQRDGQQARALTQVLLSGVFANQPKLPVVRATGTLNERVTRVLGELSVN